MGEAQPGDFTDLQTTDLVAAVAAFAGVVGNGNLPPGQGFELAVQLRLVALDDAHIRGVLDSDEVVDVLALGVHRVRCHDGAGDTPVGPRARAASRSVRAHRPATVPARLRPLATSTAAHPAITATLDSLHRHSASEAAR